MAEDVKQEENKTDAKKIFGTILKVILGIAFLVLGVLALIYWKTEVKNLIKGCLGFFLLLAGMITLAIARD